jgi:iron complex transport system ATP-binding protein
MSAAPAILEIRDLRLEIAGQRICNSLSLQLHAGECLGVLGQNGTGKTTLLHTLARLRAAQGGEIFLQGKSLNTWSRKALATQLGVLFQSSSDSMPASVEETVLMGRHPHLPDWQWESAEDVAVAREALLAVNLDALATRDVNTLSGGERQRLALAMLLAQRPHLYLLDEPGNHLDIAFQVRSLQLLREQLTRQQAALCMATHDINLAARFCDRILLLMGDGAPLTGTAREVLTPETLSHAYGCRIGVVEAGGRLVFYPE